MILNILQFSTECIQSAVVYFLLYTCTVTLADANINTAVSGSCELETYAEKC